MAYDAGLAERIRAMLDERAGMVEKKMFGGLSFLLNGNMAVGVIKDELCVRVDPERFEDLLRQPCARIFDFTGKPMKGWLMVGADGLAEDNELADWIEEGTAYAGSLPPK